MSEPSAGTRADSSLEGEIGKIVSLIAAARRLLAEGRVVDLTALEARVGTLCESIRRAPRNRSGAVTGALKAMIEDLDGLEIDVKRGYQAVTGRLEVETRRQAVGAYHKGREST